MLSQPSLPFGLTGELRRGLHVSEAELRKVDPELASMRDCDTPDDYQQLLGCAGLEADPASNSRILKSP